MIARQGRRRQITTGLFVLLAVICVALWLPGERSAIGQGIEGRLLDARFQLRGPRHPPEEIIIAAFDDAAMADSEAFPPSRADLATAVSAAVRVGAKTVVVDLLLTSRRDGDAALAEALAATDAVLAVAEAPVGAEPPALPPGGFSIVVAPPPGPALPALGPVPALAASAALGHATVTHDIDGTLRRMWPGRAFTVADGIAWYPGLAIAALAAGGEDPALFLTPAGGSGRLELGGRSVPLDLRGAIPVDFYGPAGAIRTISASAIDAHDLTGSIVFIGATAVGFGDRHASPFDATLPGVELHASLAANLVDGRSPRRDAAAWAWTAILAVATSIAGFMAFAIGPPILIALASLGVLAVTAGAMQGSFLAGWWLDATTVLAAWAIGTASGAALHLIEQRRRTVNLSRYQAPSLAHLLADEETPRFMDEARPAVVLFVDVEGFTGHAEGLSPRDTEAFLRLFHGLLEDAAERSGGTIAHFAGDGAMVVFGLPDPGPDDAGAAFAFVEHLYAAMRAASGWPGLGLRVGGHAGPVQTGLVGGQRHRHLSVSGDVVNTASRLQELARAEGAALAVSETLVQSSDAARAWADRSALTPAGARTLRGRRSPIDVWLGPAPGT